MSFGSSKTKIIFSVNVDDMEMTGRKQNLSLMRKKLMIQVDLGEPTSCLYLGCTQRECKSNESIIEE